MIKHNKSINRGFTLVELLAVIAIIAVLAGILIPTVNLAQNSMNRAKSKAVFAGWMNALDQYKQEYGYYPPGFFNSSGVFELAGNNDKFVRALSGRNANGTINTEVRQVNRKAIRFYTFSEADYNDNNQLADAFGNPNVYFVVDRNGDGLIERTGDVFRADALNAVPAGGIRGNMIVYAVGGDGIDFKDVFSWD